MYLIAPVHQCLWEAYNYYCFNYNPSLFLCLQGTILGLHNPLHTYLLLLLCCPSCEDVRVGGERGRGLWCGGRDGGFLGECQSVERKGESCRCVCVCVCVCVCERE